MKIQGMQDLHTSVAMTTELTRIINPILALKKIIGNYHAVCSNQSFHSIFVVINSCKRCHIELNVCMYLLLSVPVGVFLKCFCGVNVVMMK